MSAAPWAKSSSSGSLKVRNSGETATSAHPPSIGNAATRSPGLSPDSSEASRTVPATSLPGTKGRGGLSWYSPRVCSSSGKETPAASTSTSTPLPGVSMCDASGSGTSTSRRADRGPLRSTIWIAFIERASPGPLLLLAAGPVHVERDHLLDAGGPVRVPHRPQVDRRELDPLRGRGDV